MTLAVCWKWVPSGTGPEDADARWAGVSPADHAALELALELQPAHGDVTVVCVGPPAADASLREALAAGAGRAVRLEASGNDHNVGSRAVAIALASVVADADFVLCGDFSLDRGTGSVPAFLAHELGAAQALGLVEVDRASGDGASLRALRRLDGGRREVLEIHSPAVLSVEGSVRRLRRATLAATVASRTARVDVIAAAGSPAPAHSPEQSVAPIITPYRPRARSLPAPTGSLLTRVREILDVGGHASTNGETAELAPAEAAARIIDQLRRWGYLDETGFP